jgi:hypothetical protein
VYLQGNCLACIDHLSACSRLEELHVSDQHWQQPAQDSEPGKQQQQQQQWQQQERQQDRYEQHVDEREQLSQQVVSQLTSQQSASRGDAGSGSSSQRSSTTGSEPDQQQAVHGLQRHSSETTMALAPGLRFEPASLQAISGSLRVLCAANCGIRDPGPLAVLQKLHTLDLSGNSIERLALLQPVLQQLQRLRVLDVRGSPCLQHELNYRDYIILVAADSLETLDNEAVPTSHRAFLLGLHLAKLRAQDRAEEQQQQQGRKQHGRLQHQQQGTELLYGQCVTGKPAAAAAAVSGGACVGLSGPGVKLHAARAPALRPTAAGGFNASGARIAAVLGGTRGRAADGANVFEHD